MNALAALYGRITELRRDAYARRPHWRRRLRTPVISVGNVRVGGSGKTPVVAALARLLQETGEHPAILSRGYGRDGSADGAVVVSDRERVLVDDARRSGDEPQMLARMLPGIPVIVCRDRYLAGRLAESKLGATVMLLDDGFQHLSLERDVDLVLVSEADLEDEPLPSGRLREPLRAAANASAVLVPGSREAADRVGQAIGHPTVFTLQASYGAPCSIVPAGVPLDGLSSRTAVAVAGIARPERFFDALRANGWDVRHQIAYRDHQRYSAADVRTIEALAHRIGAGETAPLVLTTAKDAVRLERLLGTTRIAGAPVWAYVPMSVSVEPAALFRDWLMARLHEAAR